MIIHGSLSDWKNGRAFSSEGIFLRRKVSENQGILPKILEKSQKIILEN